MRESTVNDLVAVVRESTVKDLVDVVRESTVKDSNSNKSPTRCNNFSVYYFNNSWKPNKCIVESIRFGQSNAKQRNNLCENSI